MRQWKRPPHLALLSVGLYEQRPRFIHLSEEQANVAERFTDVRDRDGCVMRLFGERLQGEDAVATRHRTPHDGGREPTEMLRQEQLVIRRSEPVDRLAPGCGRIVGVAPHPCEVADGGPRERRTRDVAGSVESRSPLE